MAVQITLPASESRSSSSDIPATNTVAITSLPRAFFDPLILDLLRTHFENFGEINQWVPLPGFGRVIVVYEHDQSAERAKLHSHPIALQATNEYPEVLLRVFRADRNPLLPRHTEDSVRSHHIDYLQPPPVEKNFLISPPGSPPVGWEQIREDAPNSTPLASDLMHVLKRLKIQEEQEEHGQYAMLLDPAEAGVGVFVEDCDASGAFDQGDDWVYGETMPTRERWRSVSTAMPPMASCSA
jgi:hypothetical protein